MTSAIYPACGSSAEPRRRRHHPIEPFTGFIRNVAHHFRHAAHFVEASNALTAGMVHQRRDFVRVDRTEQIAATTAGSCVKPKMGWVIPRRLVKRVCRRWRDGMAFPPWSGKQQNRRGMQTLQALRSSVCQNIGHVARMRHPVGPTRAPPGDLPALHCTTPVTARPAMPSAQRSPFSG